MGRKKELAGGRKVTKEGTECGSAHSAIFLCMNVPNILRHGDVSN